MKQHLWRPAGDDRNDPALTMCGLHTGQITLVPEEVTCRTCSHMYQANMDWYHNKIKEQANATT